MPKDTKTLGNNKARACESLGFVHKKRLCQRFDTTSLLLKNMQALICRFSSSCCQRGNDIPSRSFYFIPVGV